MLGQSRQPSEFVFPSAIQPPVFDERPAETRDDRWGWLEIFVLIQVFWAVLLFIPGSQAYRMYIRAFPYASSLVALAACARTASTDAAIPGARWVLAAVFLLILNLIHEETWVTAGLAQIVFQLAISAPVFWGARIWITHDRLERVMILILAANFMGAGLGLLQVYYPDTFLPPEFSSLATKLNPEFVSSLTYVGSGKRTIVRPPGLSDLPGGAAIAGTIAALLGFAFALRSDRALRFRAAYAGAAVTAITVVYLTQVRSMFLMIVGCMCAMVFVRLRQGRILQGGWMAATAAALVAGSFLWAVTVGGDIVSDRYLQIVDFGVLETFRDNRGAFLDYTIRHLPFEYPFGAGLGRWGMMSAYFPEPSSWQYPALYAEIQLTGWLFDGGLIMWLLYPVALMLALRQSYRLAVEPDGPLNDLAMMVMAIQLLIAGLCFTGPVFNTQMGIIFWLATAILAGCNRTLSIQAWEASIEASAEEPVERFPQTLGA
jgi:hypothetical protein